MFDVQHSTISGIQCLLVKVGGGNQSEPTKPLIGLNDVELLPVNVAEPFEKHWLMSAHISGCISDLLMSP